MERILLSENKRYLMHESGKPFFWLGDTAWMLFQKLNLDETALYIKNRAQKGFNVIQAVIIHQITDANAYGESALYDESITNTFVNKSPDLNHEHSYWNHIDKVLDMAEEAGLYMGLLPVWGSIVDRGYLNKDNVVEYGTWLAKHFRSRKNVIWILGGDIKGDKNFDIWDTLGNTIKSHNPESLMTFHPFGRTQSSYWFHNVQWLDFNMFQSGHRRYSQKMRADEEEDKNLHIGQDNWRYVMNDYQKIPIKPTLDGEPSYESIPQGLHDPAQPYWNADDVRRYAYWSVFAGSCGHTYGHNAVMQMHKPDSGKGSYSVREYWYDALDAEGAKQMHHLKDLMLSVPYFERVPDQSLIAGDVGEKYDRLLATRGQSYLFVYTFTGRSIRLNMGKITGDRVYAWWFDPKTGEMQKAGEYDNKGIMEFTPPENKNSCPDYVLILTDSSKKYFV
ncbi:MAG TPA: glycoside hydrolase family 140 protein [Clostridia bacterium]